MIDSPDRSPLVAMERVSKQFDRGQIPALHDLTLGVAPGTFLAVVGASGSGKTTLLKCINRLTDPSDGTVFVEGQDVRAVPPAELRRRVGYVFQDIGLFPHLTVAENIAITPSLLGWPRGEIAARVGELLDLVELPRNCGARMPAALSGGQRQRVGVARALAARPRIMLMDEPFGALDPLTRDALGVAYRALHDRLGLTTVMVTHDVFEAVLLADRIAVMRDGAIVADDTPQALLTAPPDAGVRALMEMPRRQAERVHALLGGTPTPGP